MGADNRLISAESVKALWLPRFGFFHQISTSESSSSMKNLSSLLLILAITLPSIVGHFVIGVTSSTGTTTHPLAEVAAPTQSGLESSVRKISLLASDLVADRNSPRIYASVR
jgi:hypothetical protein